MVIFGYSITSWGVAEKGYFIVNIPKLLDQENDAAVKEYTIKSSSINTITLLGSGFTALTMGPLMRIGRRNCIMITNLLVISGSVLCTIKGSYPTICLARFLFGAAAGGFSLFCPKFFAEISPK